MNSSRRHADETAPDDELVFTGRGGGPLDASTAFRALRGVAKRAGVPWAGLHTLRHTCATTLFRRGLNAKQVQVWLGHHSPAFTLATYVDLLPDDLPDADFLDSLVGGCDHNESDAKTREASSRGGSDPRRKEHRFGPRVDGREALAREREEGLRDLRLRASLS
jgi:hypothetical protein